MKDEQTLPKDEDLTEKGLRERRDTILIAFQEKTAQVTEELLRELATINIALGEA